jgi:hypothetical protein
LAAVPTSFPSGVKDTHEGIVRPDGDSMTSTFCVLGSKHATQEYVVPRSIPIIGSAIMIIGEREKVSGRRFPAKFNLHIYVVVTARLHASWLNTLFLARSCSRPPLNSYHRFYL